MRNTSGSGPLCAGSETTKPSGATAHTLSWPWLTNREYRGRLYEHHSDLLNEFKATAGRGPVTPNVEALQRQLAQARDHNQELAAENAQLRSKIRTLSAVITELTHDTSGANVVVSMPRKHPGR